MNRRAKALNHSFMEIIDKQFLETPWYGSRQMALLHETQQPQMRPAAHAPPLALSVLVPIYQGPTPARNTPA
jgi:putative transposase